MVYKVSSHNQIEYGVCITSIPPFLKKSFPITITSDIWLVKNLTKKACYKWIEDFSKKKDVTKKIYIKRRLLKLLPKKSTKVKPKRTIIKSKNVSKSIATILQDRIPKIKVLKKEILTPVGGQPGYKLKSKRK